MPENRNNLLLPLSLFLITVITRLPFTSKLLYHLDSVQFALALKHFDVTLHQPHPPGYFLYVMLGRLINIFIPDANTVFVTISILFSGLTVVAIFNLGNKLFDRKTGVVAAVLAIASPNLWLHGEVALTYVVEAFFSTVIAMLVWDIYKGKDRRIWITSCTLAVAGGIRQSSAVFLLPLCFFPIRNLPFKKIVAAIFLFIAVSLLWFVPMLVITGGLDVYLSAFRELWTFTAGQNYIFENAWFHFRSFTSTLFHFIVYGIGGGTVVLIFSFYHILRNRKLKILAEPRTVFFSVWILPLLLFHFYIGFHPYIPGHALLFLPPLILLVAKAIIYMETELYELLQNRMAIATVSVLILANLYIFFVLQCPVSYSTISRHDRELSVIVKYFRSINPGTTALFADYNDMFFGFAHMMYYLPEYTICDPNAMTSRTGEIRKVFARVNGQTFLTHGIALPSRIAEFATLFYDEDMKNLSHECKSNGVSIRKLSHQFDILSGPISRVRCIFSNMRMTCDLEKQNRDLMQNIEKLNRKTR